jgi:type I restriction-modification system DNA methylase subunit
MSRKSAERKFDQTADEHQRNFVSLITQFSYGHHLDTVFRDFVELAALAISNSVDRAQFDAREKRYLEIVGKYKKEEVARFPLMLAEITLAFEKRVSVMAAARERGVMASNLTDVLGETYMMLDLGNDRSGQYFTPYHISKLMAGLIGGDTVARADAQGFARVHEPACGAGGMVIAMAEAFHDAGLNYQQAMHATCIDIDPCLRAREKEWTSVERCKYWRRQSTMCPSDYLKKWTERALGCPSSAARSASHKPDISGPTAS